jgi:hypothetical protein
MTDPTPWLWFLDAIAVWRLTWLITRDAFPPIAKAREWVLRRWPGPDTEYAPQEVETDEHGPRNADGQPITGRLRETGVRVGKDFNGKWVGLQRRSIGYLVSCPWCVSVWIAAGAWFARREQPAIWTALALILSFSAVASLISFFVGKAVDA